MTEPIRVLVLTSFADDEKVVAAVRAGAAGYLLKEASPEQVSSSVRAVHRGEPLLHPEALRSLMRELAEPTHMPEGTVTILFTDVEDSSGVFERGREILLSEATKAVAGRTRIRLEDRGEHRLRGLREPCRLYEAVWKL